MAVARFLNYISSQVGLVSKSLFRQETLKLLVTGGVGFIGSNFIRTLLAQHDRYEVVNVNGDFRIQLAEVSHFLITALALN